MAKNSDESRSERIARAREHYRTRAARRAYTNELAGRHSRSDSDSYDVEGKSRPGSTTLRLRQDRLKDMTWEEDLLKAIFNK